MAKSSPRKPHPNLGGFVLAGGRSSRMGRDKAGLFYKGRPLLDHMTALLSTVCAEVHTVGRGRLLDRTPGKGPLGGIATALEASGRDRILIVAVDLPLLTPAFLEFLADRTLTAAHPLTACRVGGSYPLALGIDRSLASMARESVEAKRLAVHTFIDAATPEIVPEEELAAAGFPAVMFSNFNTPEDWQRLRRLSPSPDG